MDTPASCRQLPRGVLDSVTLLSRPDAVAKQLVPAVLAVFREIEAMERDNTYNERFHIRFRLALLLEYLWSIPCHREAWARIGAPRSPVSPHPARECTHVVVWYHFIGARRPPSCAQKIRLRKGTTGITVLVVVLPLPRL